MYFIRHNFSYTFDVSDFNASFKNDFPPDSSESPLICRYAQGRFISPFITATPTRCPGGALASRSLVLTRYSKPQKRWLGCWDVAWRKSFAPLHMRTGVRQRRRRHRQHETIPTTTREQPLPDPTGFGPA